MDRWVGGWALTPSDRQNVKGHFSTVEDNRECQRDSLKRFSFS